MNDTEIKACRDEQASRVMPLIGGLLDAWDALPNDIKEDTEILHFAAHVEAIDNAMEQAAGDRQLEAAPSAEAIAGSLQQAGCAATWPDIGKDPLKVSDMDTENALERLRKACSLQQKEVPDQTALCWRIDLSRALGEISWRRGQVRVMTETQQQHNAALCDPAHGDADKPKTL